MSKATKPVLRIGKLPNLTPIKLTVSLSREVHEMLEDYARVYRDSYGDAVKPAELVPFIIKGFLAADNGFKRARKALKK